MADKKRSIKKRDVGGARRDQADDLLLAKHDVTGFPPTRISVVGARWERVAEVGSQRTGTRPKISRCYVPLFAVDTIQHPGFTKASKLNDKLKKLRLCDSFNSVNASTVR